MHVFSMFLVSFHVFACSIIYLSIFIEFSRVETQFYRMPTVGEKRRRMQSTPKKKKEKKRWLWGQTQELEVPLRDETRRDPTRSMLLPLQLALSVRYQLRLRLRLCIPLESELFSVFFFL